MRLSCDICGRNTERMALVHFVGFPGIYEEKHIVLLCCKQDTSGYWSSTFTHPGFVGSNYSMADGLIKDIVRTTIDGRTGNVIEVQYLMKDARWCF